MNKDNYKEIVIDFFNCFTRCDVDGALGHLDENLIWQAMGTSGELPISGKRNKEETGELIKDVKGMMPGGLQFTFTDWTIEGNRVAAEIESYGEVVGDKVYNNYYHFLFVFNDNKISIIKEYLDTLHVSKIFVQVYVVLEG